MIKKIDILFKQEIEPDEYERIQRLQKYERSLWREGKKFVAGIDEAGRGPLAGPVVAGAVIFDKNPKIPFVDDSKKLSSELREHLYGHIIKTALFYGIGVSQVDEIDNINIYQASLVAMQRALDGLGFNPDHLLIDGKAYPSTDFPHTTIVKGDSLSYSIAAASILAKVTRDRIMENYDKDFPQYGFSNNKGYATQEHLNAIEEFGFCAIHRRSFHPKRIVMKDVLTFDFGE